MTTLSLIDAVSLADEKPRITRDGYLVANVRIARTGIQTYSAAELGLTDRAAHEPVSVYRPEAEVFAPAALASMAHRPITDGHPSEPVTSDNWSAYAKGDTGDEVVRDGDFVRVPIKLMDGPTIDAVRAGKRELSVGYSCEVEFIDGVTSDGHKYQAVQRNIRGNHLAICDTARGGPALAIIDERRTTPEPKDGERPMAEVKMTFDGLPFSVADATAEAVVNKIIGARDAAVTAKDAAEAQVATLTASALTKDAEIATLKQSLADAQITPEKLRDAAQAYAKVVGDAKRIAPTVTIADNATPAQIKAAVVAHKLGDAAQGWTEAQNDIGFATLAAQLGDAGSDDVANVILDGATKTVMDAEAAAYAANVARLTGAKKKAA